MVGSRIAALAAIVAVTVLFAIGGCDARLVKVAGPDGSPIEGVSHSRIAAVARYGSDIGDAEIVTATDLSHPACAALMADRSSAAGPEAWTETMQLVSSCVDIDPSKISVVAVLMGPMTASGWWFLTVESNQHYVLPNGTKPEAISHDMGIVEGNIMAKEIGQAWTNYRLDQLPSNTLYESARRWVRDNVLYMTSLTAMSLKDYEQLLGNVALNSIPHFAARHQQELKNTVHHLHGLTMGYEELQANATLNLPKLDLYDLHMFNSQGDMETILMQIQSELPQDDADYEAMPEAGVWDSAEEAEMYHHLHTHCSSLTKVIDDDVIMGHTTWDVFSMMLRVAKSTTNVKSYNAAGVAQSMVGQVFSTQPSLLTSVDDYYVINSGLIVTETTNGIYSKDLLKHVSPQSLLSWVRVSIANIQAESAKQWTEFMSQLNSGTYNNQWMILDTDLVNKARNATTPGAKLVLAPETYYVLEQIPGIIAVEDMTPQLNGGGYWNSYNIPAFKTIYELSGFPAMVKQYGNFFSHEHCARANIFRAYVAQVRDGLTMAAMLRYNDWQKDPLALGSPYGAISSRGDLVPADVKPTNPFLKFNCFGSTDGKYSTASAVTHVNLGLFLQSGPTFDQQPKFSFSDRCAKQPHAGIPDQVAFDWVGLQFGPFRSE